LSTIVSQIFWILNLMHQQFHKIFSKSWLDLMLGKIYLQLVNLNQSLFKIWISGYLSGIQTKEQHMNLKAYILHFFPVYLDFWSVFKVVGLNAKPDIQILKGLWCEFSKTLIPLCFGKAWLQNDLENTCTEQLCTLEDFDIFRLTILFCLTWENT